MIEVKNVTKKYPNIKAVDNISFEIKDGEVVGFLRPVTELEKPQQ